MSRKLSLVKSFAEYFTPSWSLWIDLKQLLPNRPLFCNSICFSLCLCSSIPVHKRLSRKLVGQQVLWLGWGRGGPAYHRGTVPASHLGFNYQHARNFSDDQLSLVLWERTSGCEQGTWPQKNPMARKKIVELSGALLLIPILTTLKTLSQCLLQSPKLSSTGWETSTVNCWLCWHSFRSWQPFIQLNV